MDSRVIAIALVVALSVCFVGSCTAGTFALVSLAVDAKPDFEPPRRTKEAPRTSAPAVVAEADAEPEAEEPPPEVKAPPPASAPTAFVPRTSATAQLAVFFIGKPRTEAALWKDFAARAKKAKFHAGNDDDTVPVPRLVFRFQSTDDYAVIEGDAFDHARGLSDKDKDALSNATQVVVVDVELAATQVGSLRDAARVVGDFAAASGGVVWDEENQAWFSAREFQRQRVDGWQKGTPDVGLEVTIFEAQTARGINLDTMGLEHFALPELSLPGVPLRARPRAVVLLKALAQHLVERPAEAVPGRLTLKLRALRHDEARKRVEVMLTDSATEETDVILTSVGNAAAPRLELSFPGGGSPAQRVEAATRALFGTDDDEGLDVPVDTVLPEED